MINVRKAREAFEGDNTYLVLYIYGSITTYLIVPCYYLVG